MARHRMRRYDSIRPLGASSFGTFQLAMSLRAPLALAAAFGLLACDTAPQAETRRHIPTSGHQAAFLAASPEDVDVDPGKLARFSERVESWVESGDLVGAEVLIVKDGRAAFHEAFGWHDREERVALERNAVFSVQSMAKPYVATAALILVDDGLLSLDDPVQRYIPAFPDDSTKVHHLLSHTSGYDCCESVSPAAPEWYGSLREWVDTLVTDERTAPWGSYAYTDYNYNFLGVVVEEVTGAPVEDFIEDRILLPLRMRETFTDYSPDSTWVDRVPRFYTWIGAAGAYRPAGVSNMHYGPWSPGVGDPWPFFPGSSGIFTTAADHAVFMSMWMNGGEWDGVRILSEETVHEALRVHGVESPGVGYGFGWEVREEPQAGALPHDFRHSGIDGTIGIAFPGEDIVIVAMSQARKRGDSGATALLDALATLELFDGPGAFGPRLVSAEGQVVDEHELRPEQLASYEGVFVAGGPDTRSVERFGIVRQQEGRLLLTTGEPGRSMVLERHLVPLGDHRFGLGRYRAGVLEALAPRSEVRFRVEDGVATTIRVQGMGDFVGSRSDSATLQAASEWAKRIDGIDELVLEALEAEGPEAARALSRRLHSVRPDSVRFSPFLLNSLGHRLLQEERLADAIAVFETNVETYPDIPNAHDSLAEAYRQAGQVESAVQSAERAVELARVQGSPGLGMFTRRLERARRAALGG